MNISTTHSEGIVYYAFFYLLAVIVAVSGAAWAARKQKISFAEFAFIISAGTLTLLIGSKLAVFKSMQWQSLFLEGHVADANGKSVLGAISGMLIGGWLAARLCRKEKIMLDLFAVSFPVAMAVQRIGCLFSGCCYGVVTAMPWGITYGAGSRPFELQKEAGLISAGATHSLPVHPDQIYSIAACLFIAFIVWKTSSRLKAGSSRFIFSILLYLGFRFAEEFLRFTPDVQVWMGLKIVQWKVLGMALSLSLLLFYRERKYIHQSEMNSEKGLNEVHLFFLSIITLLAAFRLGNWLTMDERTIVLFTVLPLCGSVVFRLIIKRILSQKFLKAGVAIMCCILLMSQKTDVPESYFAVQATPLAGSFSNTHNFHYQYHLGGYDDCFGPYDAGYSVLDRVPYIHSYGGAAAGISHKSIINKWQSTLTGLNLFIGQEAEDPQSFYSPDNFKAPSFKRTLYGINPTFQYDGRGIGIGLGFNLGILGYDKNKTDENHNDYTPELNKRKFTFQGRVRFFSERYIFMEILNGYDAGAFGQDVTQILFGSRFNTDKYMFKFGLASAVNINSGVVFQGQFLFASRYCIYPELILFDDTDVNRKGYRSALTLQYRFYKKKEKK